jgi:hypothetical protein
VLTAPVDPRMTRGLDIPKASPETVAKRIFDGVDDNEHEIFPMQRSFETWGGGAAKAFEHPLQAQYG